MGTKFKGSAKEIAALNTFIKITRCGETLNSRFNLILSENSLTEGQFNVLDALYHLGNLTQKELSKKLMKSGGNITMVIDNLEKLGFVRRKRGDKDRRTFSIQLTAAGKSKFKVVIPQVVNFISEKMNVLTFKEQQELQKICRRIGLGKK